MTDVSQDEIIKRYKTLSQKRDQLLTDKIKIEAELSARKRSLKEAIDSCKSAGFNPDTLTEDIKKLKEVINVKLDIFEADLKNAEDIMKPMIKEIG